MEEDENMMEFEDIPQRVKKFTFRSYEAQLRDVHASSKIAPLISEHNVEDTQSHFQVSLDQWRQLNLSPSFVSFAGRAENLSGSLAMLLHHWEQIIHLWVDAVATSDEEGFKPLIELSTCLIYDLRKTLLPVAPVILTTLLSLIPRKLQPDVLELLLTALTAHLKYLVVTNPTLVDSAWPAFLEAATSSNQSSHPRMLAEVWGHLLRKLQKDDKQRAARLLTASLSTKQEAEFAAWCVVEAARAKQAQGIYTTATELIGSLLDAHIDAQADHSRRTLLLLRRALTALIHHSKTESFAGVAEVVVAKLEMEVGRVEESRARKGKGKAKDVEEEFGSEEERMVRALEVSTIICAVRKGAKLTSATVAILLALVPRILSFPTTNLETRSRYRECIVTALIAGDMAAWIGPGRRTLDTLWKDPMEGMRVAAILSELEWSGWKSMMLPHVLRRTPETLASSPSQTLSVLAQLYRADRLEIDPIWAVRVGSEISAMLRGWRIGDNTTDLLNILALSPLLQDATSSVVRIAELLHAAGRNNDTSLGAALQAMDKLDCTNIVMRAGLVEMVERWGWSESVMDALVKIQSLFVPTSRPILLVEILPHLLAALTSHSRILRSSALHILSGPCTTRSSEQDQVLARLIAAENVPLTVQSVRERMVYIGKVPTGVVGGDGMRDVVVRWLVAQLKINLRPLWAPAIQALGSLALASGCAEEVWNVVFGELEAACANPRSLILGATDGDEQVRVQAPKEPSTTKDSKMDLDQDGGMEVDITDTWEEWQEDEKTWRCPRATTFVKTVRRWQRDDIVISEASVSPDRLDLANYETQLLLTLGGIPSILDKHTRALIPLFFEFASPTAPTPMKPPRAKTMAWLTTLSKLGNPKAAFRSQDLHALYTKLLSHPDRPLQSLALTCLLTFKESHTLAVEHSLRMFLDETKWREEMTSFSFLSLDGELKSRAVEVIIRLLYGTMLEKNRRDRKSAVLTLLSACSSEELGTLVRLMLAPFEDALVGDLDDASTAAGGKHRTGFLVLLADVLKNLGPKLLDYWPQLIRTTMVLLRDAQALCKSNLLAIVEEDVEELEELNDGQALRQARSIRQAGLKRFIEFFRSASAELFDFSPYVPTAFRWFISPRVPLLSRENTQAPSGIMDLFYTWSLDAQTAIYLVEYDANVLPQVFNCLTAVNVKSSVVLKVFDVVQSLLDHSEEHQEIRAQVVDPHMSHLLVQLATMVERSSALTTTTDLIQRQLRILCQISPYISDEGQATRLLSLLSPMLRRPAKIISEKVKTDLLGIVKSTLPFVHALKDRSSETYRTTYELVSSLFQFLRTRSARVVLVEVFEELANVDATLLEVAHIVTELNAYSVKRMSEADFDRRLTAFGHLNEELHGTLTCEQWLPLLYNMLFFIQDPDELSIRSSASLSLKRFVDLVATHPSTDYEKNFVHVLYPGLRHGLKSKIELVRVEILSVLAHAVAHCDSVSALAQLRPLLADGDDEANFFLNIYHIQIHRRTRALRRLAEFAGKVRSTTLSDVFVPLIGHFVEAVATTDHLLVNEAITTIGRVAAHLAWGSYNSAVQHYLKLARERVPTTEKAMIRTVVSILDNFHFKMGESVEIEKPDVPEDSEVTEILEADPGAVARDLKRLARIEEAVTTRLLPSLLQYLEKRDEAEEAIRIPIAIGIARIAMHLPQVYQGPQISKLVVVLSQILRSKSQDVRDLTRETLCKIATIIGPESLSLMIRELRGALTRGPQLHVLAFVTHSILVHVTTGDHATHSTALDSCASDIAHISAEVIFGQSGKDVQSEEFKTKMREVRSSASKALDSFMITAKYITTSRIATLLVPIRAIMHETVAIKPMQQAEDVLRRVANGLNTNTNIKPVDILVLCHTLISQNAKFLRHTPAKKHHRKTKSDFDIDLKRNSAPDADFYAANSFRFVAFGLDIFITGFRRGKFNFSDPDIIARLEPMVVVIGNTLYSLDGHVVVLGLKAAATIVKCPLESTNKSLPAFVKQILEIIRSSGNSESEVVQTALKSLAIIVRDCPAAKLQEKDLSFLLEVISPDIEEPERQAAVFSLLRAIVARKFVVPEIYDLMAKVSDMLVTNQSTQVQELCRSVLLQFLLDYPQGKGRLRTQLTTLARNLDYLFDSGRKSVMELLGAVFAKFTDAIVDEYADVFFVALVLRIANDDTPKCREMAAALIKQLLVRVGEARRKSLLVHVQKWAGQEENGQLAAVAAQIYGLLLDALHLESLPFVDGMLVDLSALVQRSAYSLDDEHHSMEIDSEGADLGAAWQLAYHTLTSLGKIYKEFPDRLQSTSNANWEAVFSHLLFPHAWVRLAACRLVGTLFASLSLSGAALDLGSDISKATISNSKGGLIELRILVDVAQKLCLQLRGSHLDEDLSTQVVKNLFYIGKAFALVHELAGLGGTDEEMEGNDSDGDARIDPQEDQEEVLEVGMTKALANPLAWLFSKLSYQARSAHIARLSRAAHHETWHVHISSIFRWFAAMASYMSPSILEHFLPHILAPVYRIAEEDTIKDSQIETLKTLTHELQSLLQQRTGTTAFATAYSRIRQGVVRVRRERKIQRATQMSTQPQAAARRKLQRNIAKKEGRKRKDRSFADSKIRNNAVKRRRRAEDDEM